MSAKLAQVIPTVTADMIQQNTFLPDPFPSFYTFQVPASNLDWPGLTLPPDIAGAYSTHICHANLTQGSLTYTSCESSGFRHLYEILHRCDVRSLYGRSWQTKTKGFFQTKVSFLLFLCSFVFSPCLFLSHFATTPSKPGISRSSGQTVQMYRPRSSFPGRSFLKPIDFF